MGWSTSFPNSHAGITATYKKDGQTLKARDLAINTVYKWYRVKELVSGGFRQPGLSVKDQAYDPTELSDLMPLRGHLVEMVTQPDGSKKHKTAFVSGVFQKDGLSDTNTGEGTLFDGSFSIDAARGIVQFGEPVFKLGTTGAPEFADLRLTCAHHTRTNGIAFRHETRRKGRNSKHVGPLLLKHPEIQRTIINNYVGDTHKTTSDNRTDVEKEAQYYIDAAIDQLEPAETTDVQYEGLHAVEQDGAIQQVSWQCGNGQPATTRVSRNVEYSPFHPSYGERRRQERNKKQIVESSLLQDVMKISLQEASSLV